MLGEVAAQRGVQWLPLLYRYDPKKAGACPHKTVNGFVTQNKKQRNREWVEFQSYISILTEVYA